MIFYNLRPHEKWKAKMKILSFVQLAHQQAKKNVTQHVTFDTKEPDLCCQIDKSKGQSKSLQYYGSKLSEVYV